MYQKNVHVAIDGNRLQNNTNEIRPEGTLFDKHTLMLITIHNIIILRNVINEFSWQIITCIFSKFF